MSVEPQSRQLYDLMWRDRPNENYDIDRFKKLYDLIGNVNVNGADVLDVCCGRAAKAFAALEHGANVTAHDGSYEGPMFLQQKAVEAKLDKNLKIIPGVDITHLLDNLNKQFDIVYMGFALHHLDDYEKALRDIIAATKPDGLVAISYFSLGTTSQITSEIRKFSLGLPIDEVADLTAKLGKRPGYKKTTTLKEILLSDADNMTINAIRLLLKEMKFHVDDVEAALHIEDMLTPHLKNLPDEDILNIINENCILLFNRNGLIRARKK